MGTAAIESGHNISLIIKKDAVEEDLCGPILDFVNSHSNFEIVSTYPVDLSVVDALTIYTDELAEDPSESRAALIAMNAMAMAGRNMVAGLRVSNAVDHTAAFAALNEIKGKTARRDDKETIRGLFPYTRPEGYDDYPFWFRAPFFVRNRVHVPSSVVALESLHNVVLSAKGITTDMLYDRETNNIQRKR
jgi:nucleoside diphosphate kinase